MKEPSRGPITAQDFEAFAELAGSETHDLDVYLASGQLKDVRVDGESVYPTWFKIEFKESGEVSAKVKGIRLSTRTGDTIRVHNLPDSDSD